MCQASIVFFQPLILLIGSCADYYEFPDYDMDNNSCQLFLMSVVKLDNDLLGLTDALFPVLFNSSNQVSRQIISDTPLITPRGLLSRRKRSTLSDIMKLSSANVVFDIINIFKDEFVKRNLQKIVPILGQFGPCSMWMFGYFKYWYDIIRILMNDHYAYFFGMNK